MMRLNALPRNLQRFKRRLVDRFVGGLDLLVGNAKASLGGIKPIKLPRIVDDGAVAFLAHTRDDVGDDGTNLFRNLTLRGQQISEESFEIAVGRGEPDGHAMSFLIVVARPRESFPGGAGVCKPRFNALHLQAERSLAGKNKLSRSGRRLGPDKMDGQQGQDLRRLVLVDTLGTN